jgi:glycosyltransferase involved in cell wall biosynthesis
MENIINYSIIIPHKNIPNLLFRCLNSIPKRNDIQIVIIDDNSDSDTIDSINQSHLLKEEYIEIYFMKENKGAGHARNIGISQAQGKWILFADADDFFHDCFNDILDDYENSVADIIYFKVNSVDSDTYIPTLRGEHLNKYIDLSQSNYQKSQLMLKYKFGEPWGKIVKKSLIDMYQIKFDEILLHNDTTFSYLIGFYSQNIIIDQRVSYCVTTRKGSISNTPMDMEKILVRISVFAKSYKFFQSNDIPVREDRHIYELLKLLLSFDLVNYHRAKRALLDMNFSNNEIVKLLTATFFRKIAYLFAKIIRLSKIFHCYSSCKVIAF